MRGLRFRRRWVGVCAGEIIVIIIGFNGLPDILGCMHKLIELTELFVGHLPTHAQRDNDRN